MAKTVKALREEQAELETKMMAHRDKITADAYKFDAADETAWTRMNDEHNQRASMIRQIEKLDDIASKREKSEEEYKEAGIELRAPKKKKSTRENPNALCTIQERNQAIAGYMVRFLVGASAVLTPEHRSSMEKAKRQGFVAVKGRQFSVRLNPIGAEFRQLQERYAYRDTQQRALAFGAGAGNVGMFGPTDDFLLALETNMLLHGPMLQVADTWRTEHGRPMTGPFVDDTANEGDIVGEAAAVSAAQDPTFGEQIWNAYKVRSKKIIYSAESEEDSVFNLPGLIGALLGERIGRGTNRYCTTGTGTGQHEGIVIGAALGVTAASATAFTADELIDLEASVDPAYRMNAAYMLHDTTLAYVRKLKFSGTGEYVYNFNQGMINSINGRPYQVNNHMASARTTGQKLVLFGEMKKYKLRQVKDIRMRRYVELHGDNDQDAVQAFLRSDGKIQSTGTPPIKRLQLL